MISFAGGSGETAMTLGFRSSDRLLKLKQELPGWALDQVHIDKYHVMFWFEDGNCLLNIAFRFSYRASDNSLSYVYDVQGPGDRKSLVVERLLRRSIAAVESHDERHLDLIFESGDILQVHDSPEMRSAWFYRYDPKSRRVEWFVEDIEPEEA
jgi:hypothetical protein